MLVGMLMVILSGIDAYHSDTKNDHKNKRTHTDHDNHNGPLWNGQIILGQLHIRVQILGNNYKGTKLYRFRRYRFILRSQYSPLNSVAAGSIINLPI